MNDPCGAIYVPETREYIVCYQWNPGTAEGGNTAWGMAKSRDLITWEDCAPALRNGTSYDQLGVFSGSITFSIVDGRRVLFLFYTSVSALPIHVSDTCHFKVTLLIRVLSGPSLISKDVKANPSHFRLTLEHHGTAFRTTPS